MSSEKVNIKGIKKIGENKGKIKKVKKIKKKIKKST